jgi:hypothetical protein
MVRRGARERLGGAIFSNTYAEMTQLLYTFASLQGAEII